MAMRGNLQAEYLMRSREGRRATLDALHQQIRRCRKCRLCESRTRAVPGAGPLSAPVMFVGEAPGAAEDGEDRPRHAGARAPVKLCGNRGMADADALSTVEAYDRSLDRRAITNIEVD